MDAIDMELQFMKFFFVTVLRLKININTHHTVCHFCQKGEIFHAFAVPTNRWRCASRRWAKQMANYRSGIYSKACFWLFATNSYHFFEITQSIILCDDFKRSLDWLLLKFHIWNTCFIAFSVLDFFEILNLTS